MDQDHTAAAIASQIVDPNFRFVRSNFSAMSATLGHLGVTSPDAFIFDIGFSSMQIDDPGRGFSFLRDGPLDMRMDQSQPLTAADIVNWYSETDLRRILLEVLVSSNH
jgi:16S rRNA (cytosine1402-N4)-methyltransferase